MQQMALPLLCLAAALIPAASQQVGTLTKDYQAPFDVQRCSRERCSKERLHLAFDANGRWVHDVNDAKPKELKNCFNGTSWDPTLCRDAKACTEHCALEGVSKANYKDTYGVTANPHDVTLSFATKGKYGTNVGSRLYMMESEDRYKIFRLKNREISFDVNLSSVPCGIDSALYFVEMEADGGKSSSNKAGAKYGTGYCDASCPHNVKFIEGEANIPASGHSGDGRYGTCCNEIDLWEANSMGQSFTVHPCEITGQMKCEGRDCGDPERGEQYMGVCDKDGCDFNAYRNGAKDFYGPGKEIDTGKPFTVVTQFLTADNTDSGDLSEIKRYYIQNGKAIANAESTAPGVTGGAITDKYCRQQKMAYVETRAAENPAGDFDQFSAKGGLKTVGDALSRGMVLVVSLWDDAAAGLRWLDSEEPLTVPEGTPGRARGPCPIDSGKPEHLLSKHPDAQVTYSNFKYGALYSTNPKVKVPESSGAIPGGSEPFDCTAGARNWARGWSEMKKLWCCSNYQIGCEGAETVTQGAVEGEDVPLLTGGWKEMIDGNNKPYWWNPATGEKTWSPPPDLARLHRFGSIPEATGAGRLAWPRSFAATLLMAVSFSVFAAAAVIAAGLVRSRTSRGWANRNTRPLVLYGELPMDRNGGIVDAEPTA